MIVIRKKHDNGVTIASLEAGDCFSRNNIYHLLLEDREADGDFKGVDLETGITHLYPPDTMVTPVKLRCEES